MLSRSSVGLGFGLVRAQAAPKIISSSSLPLQLRTFSASPARRDVYEANGVITFKKTSSNELDSVLSTIRERVIMPAYLPEAERAKLRNKEFEQELTANPPEVKVRGLPNNIIVPWRGDRDEPNGQKLLSKAITLMKTDADFAAAPALLRGWNSVAKRTMGPSTTFSLSRRLAQGKQFPMAIALARDAAETHFRLNHPEVVNRLLTDIQIHVADKGYEEGVLTTALDHVHTVFDLMEHDEQHKPDPGLALNPPMLRDPMPRMARLHLAAALMVKYGKTSPEDNVPALAAEMVALWPEGTSLLEIQPSEVYKRRGEMDFAVRHPGAKIWFSMPVLLGLRLAADAVRTELPDVAAQLEKRAQSLEAECETTFNSKGLPVRTTFEGKMYEKLVRGQKSE